MAAPCVLSFFLLLANFSRDFSIVFLNQAYRNTGQADEPTIKESALQVLYETCVSVNFAISGQLVPNAPININPKSGGGRELDNFEKSLTNSPTIGKNFVSKIPWMGHQICYII